MLTQAQIEAGRDIALSAKSKAILAKANRTMEIVTTPEQWAGFIFTIRRMHALVVAGVVPRES